MSTKPKTQAIRRARHQLSMIQARRRARMSDIAAADYLRCRALGFGVCDSIHRATTSTGRPMPDRSAGNVFEGVAWCSALAGGLLIVAAIVF